MGFVKSFKFNLVNFIISIFYNKKTTNTSNVYVKNSDSVYSMNSTCTLKFSSKTEEKEHEISQKLKVLLKKYMNNPEKLIQSMRLKGLKIYKIDKAEKILAYIGEKEGFITPLKGINAIILNLVTGILCEKKLNISFSTKEMFVFEKGETEIYALAYALHRYYGFKNKLPGYDYKSQEIYKIAYKNRNNTKSKNSSMSLNQIYSCKEAIARNIEAMNFAIELSLENERSKKALSKLVTASGTDV